MRYSVFEKESGLAELIQTLNEKNKGELNIPDLKVADKFYEEVIVKKYDGHFSQGYLKSKFIFFAVYAFDLAPPAYPKAKTYLVKYTRELVKGNLNPELTVKCLEHVKDLVEISEYNEMLKQTDFTLRYEVEKFEGYIKELNNYNTQESKLESKHLEKMVSFFKELRFRVTEMKKKNVMGN